MEVLGFVLLVLPFSALVLAVWLAKRRRPIPVPIPPQNP